MLAKTENHNPTNSIPKALFMMMMLSGEVWVGIAVRNYFNQGVCHRILSLVHG